jgi:tRNA(Ile)-lysidine synthase
MGWVEDPSNCAQQFERVRWRMAGVQPAFTRAEERTTRDAEVARFLAGHAEFQPEGFVLLDAPVVPPAALGALIRTVAGAPYPPRQDALARLGAKMRPATLGGVRILAAGRLGPGWLLAREPSACAAPVAANPGALWDGRFCLDRPAGPGLGHAPLSLGALGADAAKYRKFGNLPSIVLRGMPALRDSDGNLRFPAPVRFAPAAPATSHPFQP